MMQRTKMIVLLWSAVSGLAFAEVRYDLAQLEKLTLSNSRVVQAAREQVTAARFGVDTARALPNPELEYLNGTVRPRGLGSNTGDARSVSLTQPLDLPWRRQARIEVARAGLDATVAEVRTFEAETLANVRHRYYDMLRRDAELKTALEDKALMQSVRERIALRVETGEAPRFELIKADAEALNAAKGAQAAAFRLDQARAQLRQAVGVDLPPDFTLTGQLNEVPRLPPLPEMKARVAEVSPDIARARAEMVRAERQLESERAQRWPALALKATVDQDPEMKSSKVGVVMTIPLWDRRAGPIGAAAADVSRTRHEFAARTFAIDQRLAAAYQQYEIAETQVTALESGIVKQAQAALRIAEAAYRFGERGFLEVLDAQRVFRAARSELIAARYELASAWVEVERLRAETGGN